MSQIRFNQKLLQPNFYFIITTLIAECPLTSVANGNADTMLFDNERHELEYTERSISCDDSVPPFVFGPIKCLIATVHQI